jgi:hypothetical protein
LAPKVFAPLSSAAPEISAVGLQNFAFFALSI